MQRVLIIILSIVRKLKSEFSGKTFSRLNFEKPSSVEEPLPQELLAKIANCAIYTPLFKGWPNGFFYQRILSDQHQKGRKNISVIIKKINYKI